MEKSKIDWCDSTWNPVTGCQHGCEYCYARGIAERFAPFDFPHLTEDGVFKHLNDLKDPIITVCKDEKERICAYPYGFEPTFHRYRLNDYIGKQGRNIFVCSMADLFGDWVPDSWIEEVFKACKKAPQHNYLFLSKNPGRYCDLQRNGILPDSNNMWFGATYDHSNWSNHRIKGRPATFSWKGKVVHDAGDYYFPMYPEKRRFVSMEPLLYDIGEKIGSIGAEWVIVGAETGRRKNKIVPERAWVEHIVSYCESENIPVFMKSSLAEIWGEPLIQEFPMGLMMGGFERS